MASNDRPLVLDLFSGIGGFALGATWSGCDIAGFCEIDEFCCRVLAKNFPEVPIHGDVRTLTGEIVRGWTRGRDIDILVGGFPCQPFSAAGKQLAHDDERHLWPEMLRVIREVRPRWIIGENVDGIVRLALDDICVDLESSGYAVAPVVLPAGGVAAPHRRYRCWIVASLADADRARLQEQRRSEPVSPKLTSAFSGSDSARLPNADRERFSAKADRGEAPNLSRGLARGSDDGARGGGSHWQASGNGAGKDTGVAAARVADAARERLGVADIQTNADAEERRFRSVQIARQVPASRGANCGEARGEYEPPPLVGVDGTPDGFSGWLARPRSEQFIDPRWLDGNPLNAWSGAWESGITRVTMRGTKEEEGTRKNQIAALGNAVVPQIPYVLISAIREIDEAAA